MGINSTSLTNTPQAGDDTYTSATTGLTEDSLFIVYLAVMANDLGGAAKTLYSLDDGTNSAGALSPTDLLTQDIARTEALTTDRSAQGAKIWITADGKVGYDAGTLSAAFQDQLQHLSAGQFLTDTFTYAIRLGNGTLSWATATVQIAGVNDAPVVTGAVTGAALEDGSSVTLDALANASDVDSGATLSVTNLPDSLPPGVTYDALTHSFTLDPSNPAFQHLAAGDHTTVTVNYDVTDGTATTAASVSWSVTGTNDAPVITSNEGGATATLSVDENSTSVTTVTATDADDDATQTYSIVGGTDASLFTIDATTGALSFISAPNSEAPTDSDSDNLYNVTVRAFDGVSSDDQAIAVTVNDVNEFAVTTPSDTNAAANAVDENSAIGTVVGVTANASDADATTNVVSYSLTDDADGKFAIDSATGVVTVAGAIDREAHASLDITVRATSLDGSTADRSFNIAINDVNDNAPVFSSGTTASEAENTAAANVVYDANATDADGTPADNAITYSLTGTDSGLFSIDASSGEVRFLASPDHEAPADANGDNAYQIVVHANDGANDTAQDVTVTVTDVVENHAPTDLGLVITNSPGGNSLPGAGTVLGTVSATDPDAGDTFSFSLLAGTSSGFSLNASSGSLTTTLGLAEKATYTLDIQVTDAAAATYHEVFNIITGTNGTTAAADDNPLPSGGSANPALAGDDVLYGSGGNDVIYGGSGNDWIFGQNGLDRLIGGAGNDTLSGGNQSDTFVFLASDGGGTDTVVSFAAGGGNSDVLDVSNLLAGSGYTAANASQFLHLAEAGGSTTLQVDLDGSGSGYSFQDIALLQGVTGLNLGTLLASGIIDTTP